MPVINGKLLKYVVCHAANTDSRKYLVPSNKAFPLSMIPLEGFETQADAWKAWLEIKAQKPKRLGTFGTVERVTAIAIEFPN